MRPGIDHQAPVAPLDGYLVLLRRVNRPGEGFHPIRPLSRPRRRPKRRLHHFVSDPAKEESIGALKVLDRVAMQVCSSRSV
jgi:hypothetical protein